jgi:hypothetical protein
MAVTTEYSTEVAAYDADTMATGLAGGREKLRWMPVTFTQGGSAGDANSLVDLALLPAGKVVLLGDLCSLDISAFGTGRTLDIGWTAYTNSSGTAVDADIDGLDDGLDVAAASTVKLGTNTAVCGGAGRKEFDSRAGVRIQAKVLSAGIPAAATIQGFIVYAEIA